MRPWGFCCSGLSYYIDWTWASQCNPETHSGFMRFEYVHKRLLAGDKRECVYEVAFRYPFLTWEAVEAFPEELAQRARWARIDYEDGAIYYAYFHWTVNMRMVKDYVFELEGIAETGQVLAAFREQYGQTVFSDVPVLDLADEMPRAVADAGDGAGDSEQAYRTEVREGALS